MVIWIIGVSSSGKSTAANIIYDKIKSDKKIILDGDEIRSNFYPKLGFTINDRRKNSNFIYKLSKFLSNQNYFVIVPILSIFQKHRDRNRKELKDYTEIYIKSNHNILLKRDKRGIYNSKKNIVGKDIAFEEPKNYDYLIINDKSKTHFSRELELILKKINAV